MNRTKNKSSFQKKIKNLKRLKYVIGAVKRNRKRLQKIGKQIVRGKTRG